MAYFITQGTTLQFTGGGVDTALKSAITSNAWTAGLPGLLEMGEIAFNGAGGSYDQIEVTSLADSKHVYTDGLIADNDSSKEITFKFLYNPALFNAIKTNMEAEGEAAAPGATEAGARTYNVWKVTLADGSAFNISADIASIALDSVTTNDKLTFTMVLAVEDVDFESMAD